MKTIKFLKLFSVVTILSSIVLFACSPDSTGKDVSPAAAVPVPNTASARLTTSDVTNAKNLFTTMMGTSAWTTYQTSMNSFATKMKNNAVYFSTKAQYMTWISTHLSSTSWGSSTAFSTDFDDMTGKMTILINANHPLFNYLANADSDQIMPITGLGLSPVPAQTVFSNCADGCYNTLVLAGAQAWSNYQSDIGACYTVFATDAVSLGICTAGAGQYYENKMTANVSAYLGCVAGC
jgi:hypothetical protein